MRKTKEKTTIYTLLVGLMRGFKRFFILSILASAVTILLNFIMPLIVGYTVDSVIGDKAPNLPEIIGSLITGIGGRDFLSENLIYCALAIIVCAVFSGVFSYLARAFIARGTEGFIKTLRDNLFEHTQYLPFEWHTKNLTGDIIQRCTSDVETTRRFVSQQLIEVLRTFLLVVTALVILFSINTIIAAIVLAFIPIVVGYSMFFYSRIATKFKECDESEGELMVKVQENLTGVRVVRAFGRERHELGRFDEKNEKYSNKWLSLGYTLGVYWGAGDVASASQVLAVIAIGSLLAATGKITFGSLLIFISYTQTIMWPVRALGRTLTEMSKTGVSLTRIKEIFDAPRESEDPNAKKPDLKQDIVFDNVSFMYDAQPVLKNVSFTIKTGSTFAILGATGSGKSTVTYLLNRLYDLPEGGGKITVGGVDITEIDKAYLRRNIGLVLQEPFLFSKTIFENIDIASRGKDMSRVRKAAEAAAVDESIMSFAGGYDTVVGERGVTLSGGQKQRVAIARTLMTGAPIMVFDDSMSSLDMETDARIRDALRDNTEGATVILISHRISTLMTADTIMVLEDGEIREIGSHAELVAQDGLYRRVYDLQSGYDAESAEAAGKERG